MVMMPYIDKMSVIKSERVWYFLKHQALTKLKKTFEGRNLIGHDFTSFK